MRLYVLARHGESVLNQQGRVNGDPAVPAPLTERGRENARLLGLELRGLPLDACLHTRFGRTLETARIALEGRDIAFIEDELFDDVRVGELEGWTVDEYRASDDDKARKKKRGFLMGEAMKATKNQGNPQLLNRLLDARLS